MRASVVSAELAKALSELIAQASKDNPSAVNTGYAEKKLAKALEAWGTAVAEDAAMRVTRERS